MVIIGIVAAAVALAEYHKRFDFGDTKDAGTQPDEERNNGNEQRD